MEKNTGRPIKGSPKEHDSRFEASVGAVGKTNKEAKGSDPQKHTFFDEESPYHMNRSLSSFPPPPRQRGRGVRSALLVYAA